MPLARTYSPNPQAQKNADAGQSPFQQMSSAFSGTAANPTLKVLNYTLVPAVQGVPIIGNVVTFLKWAQDPVGELKKELNISPSIGGAIKESIVSNAIAGVVKVGVVAASAADIAAAAAGVIRKEGQISTELVRNAVACETAQKATLAARNPLKFTIQATWNNLIKGDILDNLIYDKQYIFWYDESGKAARWRANKYAENLNSWGRKYGAPEIKGEELKFGSQAFTTINVDRFKNASTLLKGVKVGWQTLGPTAVTAAFFPGLAPFVFGWQALNADWGQFVPRHPVVTVPDRTMAGSLKAGYRKNAFGEYFTESSGKSYGWYELTSGKHKFFKNLNDFFTIRGWYRTLVTGATLYERGWRIRGQFADQAIHFGNEAGDIDPRYLTIKRFDPHGKQYIDHFKTNNTLHLADGRVIKNFGELGRAIETTGVSRFFQGAYHTQQFASKIVAPIALAIAIPNPVTVPLAAFMVVRNLGDVLRPLKFFGWKPAEYNQVQFIAKYASKFGHNIATLSAPFVTIWEDKGTGFFRSAVRRFYSILSPFDRDVGIFARAIAWRDAQWVRFTAQVVASPQGKQIAAFLAAHPAIGRVALFIRRIPGMQLLFRTGGFFLGGIKWIIAPGQALTDSIKDFIKWVTFRGFRFAFGQAFRRWFGQPIARSLAQWARSLPAGSLRRRFVRFFLGKALGGLKPPKPPGFFGQIFRAIFKAIVEVVKAVLRFIIKIIVEAAKMVIRVVGQVVQTIFDTVATATSPVWGTIAVVVIIAAVIILLLILVILLIILAVMYLSATGAVSPYNSPPVSDYLEIRKEVANPKPPGGKFVAGETIEYTIKYKIKKTLKDPINFEDKFLMGTTDGSGNYKPLFKDNTFACQSPANTNLSTSDPDPEGPAGQWRGVKGTVPNSDPATPTWVQFSCSAQVDTGYVDGTLMNHALFSAKDDKDQNVFASQWLYVNGGSASGWPVEHGCFTQGPNGAFTHQHQQALDIGSNWGTGYNIMAKPAYATINGKVLRICIKDTYTASTIPGVCGGVDEGSTFGTGFGTYVIIKETGSNLGIFYAHLSSPEASLVVGQSVHKGDVVGYVDTTGISDGGAHLHYAFTRGSGIAINQPYIPYYVPTCSNTWPDPTCANAFASMGEASRVCF